MGKGLKVRMRREVNMGVPEGTHGKQEDAGHVSMNSQTDEMAELKNLFEYILNGIPCGVWASDRNDVIYYANRGMEMIAGVTHQKLIGCDILSDYTENTIDYFRRYYLEAKETLQPVYYSEIPVVTPAGKQTYQSGWFIPKLKENKYDGMVCILEDITNQKEIRKALRESETKYREIVENANSVIMRLDLEGNITFFNRFAREFFGYSHDEIICRNIIGTIVPEQDRSVRKVKAMLRNIGRYPERYINWESENTRKNGERVWVAWTNRAVLDGNGQIIEILCVGNDITELKYKERLLKKCRIDLEKKVQLRTAQLLKANKELEQEINEHKWVEDRLGKSEYKYRMVVENANEAIIIVQDRMCKYLNQKTERITGYTKDELISNPFIDMVVYPDDKDMVLERHLKRLKGGSVPNIYSCRIVDKNGNVKWLEINSVLIEWMGRPASLAFMSDITERKRSEERLRLLEAAFQQANDSIIITKASPINPSAQIVFVNPAFTKMMGYASEEVMADPSIILQGPRIDNAEWLKLESSHKEGKAFVVETVNYRKDGTRINLEWRISPIRNERGKITHFVSIHRDITQRKRVEEKVIAYQKQLRFLASELSLTEERERRRIATMLHDYVGQTLAISKIKLSELQHSLYLTKYHKLLDNIIGMIDKSIQYTKSLTFELSPPILYELGFSHAIEWLGEQMQKNHNVVFEFEDDGKPKTIDRDVIVLMFQAVRELFMNIVKHAHADKIKVSIKRDGGRMQISVEDDGIGFDISTIDKTKTFGFFSIHERLKYFGGTFFIDSRPGTGTRVVMTAPLMPEI